MAKSRSRMTLGAMALAGAVFAVEAERTTEGARVEAAVENRVAEAAGIEAPAPVEAPELAAAPMRVRDPRPTPELAVEASAPAEIAPAPVAAPPCRTDVVFVDAITGREIDGCVAADPGADEATIVKVPRPVWETVEGGGIEDSPRWRPKSAVRAYRVPAPYFAWREAPAATFSGRARAFRVVRPLHRELDVRLRILLPDGSRAPWGLLTAVEVDGASEAASAEGIGRGLIRVHRVPWLPERSFTLRFRATAEGAPITESEDDFIVETEPNADRDGDVEWSAVTRESKAFELTVPMPVSAADPVELDVVLDWSVVESDRLLYLCGYSCRTSCRGCGGLVRQVARGDARVRLVDAAGRPLAGVRVHVSTIPAVTDADGVARVTGAREGAGVVVVDAAGYRFGRVPITIIAGQEASLDIAEAPASTLEIHVVDVDGRPVPSAPVELLPEAFGWFDVDADGVQRLDPFTDAYGVRRCNDAPCGKVGIAARFAGRTGEADTFVRAGVPSVVTVVVK